MLYIRAPGMLLSAEVPLSAAAHSLLCTFRTIPGAFGLASVQLREAIEYVYPVRIG